MKKTKAKKESLGSTLCIIGVGYLVDHLNRRISLNSEFLRQHLENGTLETENENEYLSRIPVQYRKLIKREQIEHLKDLKMIQLKIADISKALKIAID